MTRMCILTGKRPNTANSRSHSNIAKKRRQMVNLQSRRLGGVKLRVSSRALKTLRKFQAIEKGEILTKHAKKKAKTAARQAAVKKL